MKITKKILKPIIVPLNVKIKFQKIHRLKTFNHSCKVSTWLFITVLIVNGQKVYFISFEKGIVCEVNGS